MIRRKLALASFAALAAFAPGAARAQGYPVYGPPVVGQTVVTRSYVASTPIGPPAYVAPVAYPVVGPARQVVTTTTVVPTTAYAPVTTYVPRTTYVPTTSYVPTTTRAAIVDTAVAPVGYEKIKPNGRVKVVYPRQVYRGY